jgi:hypothetical protein
MWFTDAYDKPLPMGLFVEWFATLAFFFYPGDGTEGSERPVAEEQEGIMGEEGFGVTDEEGLDRFLQSYLQG